MDSSIGSEIHVFPQIYNAKRSSSGPAINSGNNFNLEINLVAKHAYTCGNNVVEECHLIGTTHVNKYKSLSWDIVDRELLASDHFPSSLEKVKCDGVDKILESKNDLIQQILEFARTVQNVTPPFQDDDTVYMSLTFIERVFVSPQEFELTKGKILFKHYENLAEILWKKVCEEIKGLGRHESCLYEEFQCLIGFVETIVSETTNWRMCFDEGYEMVLIESLIEGIHVTACSNIKNALLTDSISSRKRIDRRRVFDMHERILTRFRSKHTTCLATIGSILAALRLGF